MSGSGWGFIKHTCERLMTALIVYDRGHAGQSCDVTAIVRATGCVSLRQKMSASIALTRLIASRQMAIINKLDHYFNQIDQEAR